MLMCKCVTPLVCTLMYSIACVNEDRHKREKEKGDQRRRECVRQYRRVCVCFSSAIYLSFAVQAPHTLML